LYRRIPGTLERMTDLPMEDMDQTQQEREREADEQPGDDRRENGEDEGEREDALPE
jgi:hypothetical protein